MHTRATEVPWYPQKSLDWSQQADRGIVFHPTSRPDYAWKPNHSMSGTLDFLKIATTQGLWYTDMLYAMFGCGGFWYPMTMAGFQDILLAGAFKPGGRISGTWEAEVVELGVKHYIYGLRLVTE